MSVFGAFAIVLGTVLSMELTAWAVHRWIMHGRFGWGWHRSHHEETEGPFEKNDLYAVPFAAVAILLFTIGSAWAEWVWWLGLGVSTYGVLYFVLHDGLVHNRWPFRYVPKRGYLRRLYQAHRLHHAVEGREGCVSFGFLYAPPVPKLKEKLRANGALGPRRTPDASESSSAT
jgi:beta-carotene 3-hydroxylase